MLVIDNYDSFTYNLVQMFMAYDLDISVTRSDQTTIQEVEAYAPDYILISPGPKDPKHAGLSIPILKRFYQTIPILGVCLGMQCINEAFGGVTVKAPEPVHGKVSSISHDNEYLFKGVPSPFNVARYHSLIVDRLPKDLKVTSVGPKGVVMGISHTQYPLHGVQFHPESFMTEHGYTLIENFLKLGALNF